MGEDLSTARLSELLQRARATGAPQEELDALMDTQDPREAVVALLQRRERRGLRQLPALFDAERVGPEALPPEGWLEVLAVEGYVTFPAVLTPELTALLAAELRAGGGGSAGGAPGPCVDALLDTGFVRALVSGALGAQYELCHHTVAEDSPAPALLPPSGLQHDGLQQEHWQPEGRAPWAETGFAAARAYLRVAFFAAGCPREAALAAVPGSCVPPPSPPRPPLWASWLTPVCVCGQPRGLRAATGGGRGGGPGGRRGVAPPLAAPAPRPAALPTARHSAGHGRPHLARQEHRRRPHAERRRRGGRRGGVAEPFVLLQAALAAAPVDGGAAGGVAGGGAQRQRAPRDALWWRQSSAVNKTFFFCHGTYS